MAERRGGQFVSTRVSPLDRQAISLLDKPLIGNIVIATRRGPHRIEQTLEGLYYKTSLLSLLDHSNFFRPNTEERDIAQDLFFVRAAERFLDYSHIQRFGRLGLGVRREIILAEQRINERLQKLPGDQTNVGGILHDIDELLPLFRGSLKASLASQGGEKVLVEGQMTFGELVTMTALARNPRSKTNII